jgi:hypothetical protein
VQIWFADVRTGEVATRPAFQTIPVRPPRTQAATDERIRGKDAVKDVIRDGMDRQLTTKQIAAELTTKGLRRSDRRIRQLAAEIRSEGR